MHHYEHLLLLAENNMIKILNNTQIYIACPANLVTGGPELLHQLAYNLKKHFNVNAKLLYYDFNPAKYPNPVHSEYKQYNILYVQHIQQLKDKEHNLLIVPELASGIELLCRFNKIRKAIWWLSIDNFYQSMISSSNRIFFVRRVINKIFSTIFQRIIFDISKDLFDISKINQANFHLVQSYYALKHLKEKGIPRDKIIYLSDYLNDDFLKIEINLSQKDDIIAYNPIKGGYFTRKIIKYASTMKFLPIINMTRKEVIKTLKKAKVYIDFGNHPGKDRIPREAAILGCCVITGEKGSARYTEDVPIPQEYKFEDKEKNIPLIVKKIEGCFKNFGDRYKDFNYYREIIKQEPQNFIEDLKKIFKK
jgi:hypothetical protein